MAKNKKKRNTNRENVINELLNELGEEDVSADLGGASTAASGISADLDGASAAASGISTAANGISKTEDEAADEISGARGAENKKAEKRSKKKKKHKFYFGFAVGIIILAIVGAVSVVVFTVGKITAAVNSTTLKDEYTRFLLPVVTNDIAPFDSENQLSNTAKINCSIWNIMLNHDTSAYKLSETGEFLIPEYDVEYSCKEIFGTSASVLHRTVGSMDMSFVYDAESHVYSCPKDLRYLNYVPVIRKMTQSGGIYTLDVDYYSPAVRFLSDYMEIEASAEKSMKYIISRYDGKNTLVAVQFSTDEVVS